MKPLECLNMNDPENKFKAGIDRAYTRTREQFDEWHTKPEYKDYVVPLSTAPRLGFAIFYNQPTFHPPLLIIGLNPANFAPGDSLKAPPNGEMLSGFPPTINSYLEHEHYFATALQLGFKEYKALFEATRGMNLWFFQTSSEARRTPPKLRSFCSGLTMELIEIVKPETILCLSSDAFAYITKRANTTPVVNSKAARFTYINGTRIWYSYHPTSSRYKTRMIGVADLPIVVADIASYLAEMAKSENQRTES